MADTDYTEEIWKVIPFAAGYAVSSHGRIMTIATGRLRAFSTRGRNKRYLGIVLFENGQTITFAVHQVVARVFLGEPSGDAIFVAHGDGNPANNHVSNLRWATRKENMADSLAHGTRMQGEKAPMAKLTEADVRAIRASALSTTKLGAMFGVTPENISSVRTRRTWKHVT